MICQLSLRFHMLLCQAICDITRTISIPAVHVFAEGSSFCGQFWSLLEGTKCCLLPFLPQFLFNL